MKFDPDVHNLQCPKCEHGMVEVSYEGVTIDRCSNCQGLWFDDDEASLLKKKVGSEVLDEGDPAEGKKWDSRADIGCPRCGKAMEKSADPKQKHIWYELCNDHGMFMDAGEFADLKEESLLDCFRGLIKGDRNIVAP
jgi:Zn-finger nucleic acid-binding protein